MDKLNAMRAFVRAVEAGTFTKAADSLDFPKAQVTRLVQALEQELKTLLLNRTTRRVTVTADGAAYYDRAVRVLDEIDEIESSMFDAKGTPKGKLRHPMPISITFFAGQGEEPALIKIGTAYESATHHRAPPPMFGPVKDRSLEIGAKPFFIRAYCVERSEAVSPSSPSPAPVLPPPT